VATVNTYVSDGPRFDFGQVQEILVFSETSRLLLGTIQTFIRCIPARLSTAGVVKQPGREADHSPRYSVGVTTDRRCTSALPIHLHGVHTYNLPFYTTGPSFLRFSYQNFGLIFIFQCV